VLEFSLFEHVKPVLFVSVPAVFILLMLESTSTKKPENTVEMVLQKNTAITTGT
jgi:hypothetical protein